MTKQKSVSDGELCLLTSADSSNPDYNADCEFAIVTLSRELASQLRRRAAQAIALHHQDNGLYELYYWGAPVEFVTYDESLDNLISSDDGWGVVPRHKIDLPEAYFQRVECLQMVLNLGGTDDKIEVKFTAIPKHSDIYVSSPLIPLDVYLHPKKYLNASSVAK